MPPVTLETRRVVTFDSVAGSISHMYVMLSMYKKNDLLNKSHSIEAFKTFSHLYLVDRGVAFLLL